MVQSLQREIFNRQVDVGVRNNLWRRKSGLVTRRNFPIDGLVFYAPLWHPELSGSPFLSKDLNAHSCTVTGATWGLWGRSFNGASDKIALPMNAFNSLSSGTIELLVYPTKNGDIFRAYVDASLFLAFQRSATKLTIYGRVGWATQFSADTDEVLPLNAWSHIAWTKTGTTHVIYVNGAVAPITWTVTTDKSVYFNSLGGVSVQYDLGSVAGVDWFGGIQGEGRIYNRALSLPEMQHNHLRTKWRWQ